MPEKKQRVKLVSPLGRLSFPAIFEKEEQMEGAEGKPKYAATVVFDKEYLKKNPDEMARWNAIRKEAETVCQGKFKRTIKEAVEKIARFWNPFRDGAEKEHLEGFGAGTLFFKASSHRKPGAIMPDKQTPITDPDKLYPGCYVRVNVTPYGYDNKSKGIGIGLNSIMFIKDGDRLDGGSSGKDDYGEIPTEDITDGKDPFDDGNEADDFI